MSTAFIEIQGLSEFASKVTKADFESAMNKPLKKSVLVMQRESKIETPVRTWLLRNSYRTKTSKLEAQLINYRNYWIYVNARNPFMKRGIMKSWVQINKIFSQEMEKFLETLTS